MRVPAQHKQVQLLLDGAENQVLTVQSVSTLASLWAGYGRALQVTAVDEDGAQQHFVVKDIKPPAGSGVSHQRKVRSYQVEGSFYEEVAPMLLARPGAPAVAAPLVVQRVEASGNVALVLGDLRGRFPESAGALDLPRAKAALAWLAALHAAYWQKDVPASLWEEGSYYHLKTRLDELQNIDAEWADVRDAAHAIDGLLCASPFRTLLHGDAKAANFLFSEKAAGGGVIAAAYDFQYTGGGDGMRDVAYLLCSSVQRAVLDRCEAELLSHYHAELVVQLDPPAAEQYTLEVALQRFELALLDYVRWMAGWGFWGSAGWAQRKARKTLATLRLPVV
jgi:hypothetical protein